MINEEECINIILHLQWFLAVMINDKIIIQIEFISTRQVIVERIYKLSPQIIYSRQNFGNFDRTTV